MRRARPAEERLGDARAIAALAQIHSPFPYCRLRDVESAARVTPCHSCRE